MKLASLLSVALLVPVAAYASSGTPGAYVQGAIGGTSVFGNNDFSFSGDATASTLSGQLAAGYLWGCDNVNYGLEAGFLYYPSAKFGTINFYDVYGNPASLGTKVDGWNFDLLAVLKYNFDNGFNVFAKGGAAYVNQKFTATIDDAALAIHASGSSTDNKLAPEVALGVGYQFDQNWGMNFTVNTVFSDSSSHHAVFRNGSALVGVSYRFA